MNKALLLVENGFEDMELMHPYYRLQEAGYKVDMVGPKVKETYKGERGLAVMSDVSLENVKIDEYDAVIIPRGRAPDRMRLNRGLAQLVKETFNKRKVVAAVCHGPQLLIEADVLKGKKATCYASVATDLKNAGGIYEDKSAVVDGNLVTSRFPEDLPDFCREILRLLQIKKK